MRARGEVARPRARRTRAGAVGALAALALFATACGGPPAVVARDGEGGVVARADLPADGRFALTYTHSVYRAAAEERFRATDGGFVLDEIASRDGRVLDYYELEGTRAREGGLWVLKPAHPARFTTMPLAATRTLVAGATQIPLYGGPVHLRLAVEGT
jgi:hypothetical protein